MSRQTIVAGITPLPVALRRLVAWYCIIRPVIRVGGCMLTGFDTWIKYLHCITDTTRFENGDGITYKMSYIWPTPWQATPKRKQKTGEFRLSRKLIININIKLLYHISIINTIISRCHHEWQIFLPTLLKAFMFANFINNCYSKVANGVIFLIRVSSTLLLFDYLIYSDEDQIIKKHHKNTLPAGCMIWGVKYAFFQTSHPQLETRDHKISQIWWKYQYVGKGVTVFIYVLRLKFKTISFWKFVNLKFIMNERHISSKY